MCWYAPAPRRRGPLPARPPVVCAGSWSTSVSLLLFASHTCSLPVSCAEAVFELPRPEVDADPIFILGCELSLQTCLLKLKITGCGSFVKVGNEAPSLAGSCLLSPEPRLLEGTVPPCRLCLGTRKSTSTMLEIRGWPGGFPWPPPLPFNPVLPVWPGWFTPAEQRENPFCLEHEIVWGHFYIFFS